MVLLLLFIIIPRTLGLEFPPEFKFGVATSAYQIEGGWNEDGKGVSVWDTLTHRSPSFIPDNSNGDIACDSYHKWQEDVEILKDLKVNHYRFSLSWTRLLPNGFTNQINQKGINYYKNLIDALLANGIEPIITIFHWDFPQNFSPLGIAANDGFIKWFEEYSRLVFDLFGDQVKTWITFNEPKVFCQDFHHFLGLNNPAYPSGTIDYLCTHNVIRAHARAYHVYRNEFKKRQNGKVGITLNFEWAEPADDHIKYKVAAEQARQFEVGIYANPLVFGNYPQVVIDRVAWRSKQEGFPQSRLPKFSFLEQIQIKGTYDFIGLNHYTSWLVQFDQENPIKPFEPSFTLDMGVVKSVDPKWESTEWIAKIVPEGLRKSLQWIKNTYKNPEILITECGYPDQSGELTDSARSSFLQKYLNSTLQALHEDKVNVVGFTVWSLMDNFEWGQGYQIKFGLYHVDFEDPERPRTPKASVEYYKSVIQTRKV